MTWRKYFKVADTTGQMSPISGRNSGRSDFQAQTEFAFRNYASRLPEVYTGHPNRI